MVDLRASRDSSFNNTNLLVERELERMHREDIAMKNLDHSNKNRQSSDIGESKSNE